MKVILVSGQLCSGKDEVSNYLASQLNKRYKTPNLWRRVGFADAVKKIFMDAFGVDRDFIEEWKRKGDAPPGFDKNVRRSLQFIGDGFRGIKANIWIEIALRDGMPKVLADGRYINEFKAVREKNGLNILVWRKNFENNDANPSESQIKPTVDWFVKSGLEGDVRNADLPEDIPVYEGQSCSPEKDLIQTGLAAPRLFDFFIRNEGTLDQLYEKIDNILIPAIEGKYVQS